MKQGMHTVRRSWLSSRPLSPAQFDQAELRGEAVMGHTRLSTFATFREPPLYLGLEMADASDWLSIYRGEEDMILRIPGRAYDVRTVVLHHPGSNNHLALLHQLRSALYQVSHPILGGPQSVTLMSEGVAVCTILRAELGTTEPLRLHWLIDS